MSFNGSGTFLINTAGQPVVSGTVISSTAFNALTADLATGLSTAITKDGQTTVTANIPMSTYKFTGLGVGSAATDSANLSQVQSTVTKLLNSVSGADTITATASPTLAAYAAGQMFYFVAAGDNTTSVTLNIDSLGAKAVTRDGSVALAAADIKSGEVIVVVYDGTRFQVVSQLNSAGDARFANVSIASSLYVGGVSTFVGNAGFSANVSIASALSVGGVAAITGATTIGGNLTLSGGTANGVLYLNGSKVATSGAVLVFDGTNLGIGTTSPITKLDVRSDAAVVATSGYSNLHFNALPASATARAATIRKNYDSPFDLNIYASTGTSGNSAATIFYRDITNESMRIDSSGNLGLGVTPSAWSIRALQVGSGFAAWSTAVTNARIFANTYYDGTYKFLGNGRATQYEQDGYHAWYVSTTSNSSGAGAGPISFTQAMTLDASGNLGVGTTSPGAKLQVVGTGQFGGTGTDGAIQFLRASDGGAVASMAFISASTEVKLNNAVSGPMTFFTNNTERARITSGGLFQVIADGANSTFTSGGQIALKSNGNNPYISWHQSTGALLGYLQMENGGASTLSVDANQPLVFRTNATERARITSGGNLLVSTTDSGPTSGSGYKFDPNTNARFSIVTASSTTDTVFSIYSTGASAYRFFVDPNGTVYATNTTISAISDQRYKENICDLDVGLDAVLALKPRKFDWKTGKGKDIKNDRGFIAQEFEQVFPDLVDEWKDPAPEGEEPYKSMRQDLIPVLVKAIQELTARVAQLESK